MKSSCLDILQHVNYMGTKSNNSCVLLLAWMSEVSSEKHQETWFTSPVLKVNLTSAQRFIKYNDKLKGKKKTKENNKKSECLYSRL